MVKETIERLTKAHSNYLYFTFRVLIGLMFAQHGAQKLFGLFGKEAFPLMSLMGVAGIIEFVGGIFIAIGLLTRTSALLSAITMLSAWFMVHASRGWIPILNGGELALLYLAGFLAILANGSKIWSVDGLINK